ncbi:hypothetical protein AKJ35_00730, partial [candidate division MSBL1 archaeon SCGC-AAA833F18]
RNEDKKKRWNPFKSLDKKLNEMTKGFGGAGAGHSISIQQGPNGTRIDVSGDVDIDKLKERYGKDAKIYKDGKRVDKPLIEVIEEDED